MERTQSWYFTFLLLLQIIVVSQASGQQLHHLTTRELIDRQSISEQHLQEFESVQVQDFQGRIKPIHTLSLELVRKIYGKSSIIILDENKKEIEIKPVQAFIGMQYKPDSWQLLPCVKVNEKIKSKLDQSIKITATGHAAVSQFFDFNGNYKIKKEVEEAFSKSPSQRDAFDKEIIKLDERINVLWGIFNGQFLKIFPKKNDLEHTWYGPNEEGIGFTESDSLFYHRIIPTYFQHLEKGQATDNWAEANETIELVKNFQTLNGSTVQISSNKLIAEIWMNKYPLFFIALIAYTIFGGILLVLSFLKTLSRRDYQWLNMAIKISVGFTCIIFLIHGLGIGLRWFISGHAPWSNGYEATIFVAWIGVLAGLLFCNRNVFSLAVASIMAFCLLGIAHGSLMNPEITNLVPVLKSYWLLIHVAVITASYGFLVLASLLAFITLVFLSIKKVRGDDFKLKQTINELTTINELSSTFGLYLLTIGTFLGGVWANESWGRYWGWDPKETWALISIIIYAFVLHLRIMIPKHYVYIYNVCSLFAVASIMMTFFGVNYYLSGLHSYAKGDPFPIPKLVYYIVVVCILVSLLPRLIGAFKNQPSIINQKLLHQKKMKEEF